MRVTFFFKLLCFCPLPETLPLPSPQYGILGAAQSSVHYFTLQLGAVQLNRQYSTEQCSAVQCSAAHYNAVQCSAVQCSKFITIQCSAMQNPTQ